MGHHAVACGNFIPGNLGKTARPGGVTAGQITTAILPDVQGADGIASFVQIDDAVHLACDADGLNVGVEVQHLLNGSHGLFVNDVGILNFLPAFAGHEGFAGHGLRRQDAGACFVDHGGNGGGADIES